MIEEVPNIQVQSFERPDPSLLGQLRSTPTGFLVDAMGARAPLTSGSNPPLPSSLHFAAWR